MMGTSTSTPTFDWFLLFCDFFCSMGDSFLVYTGFGWRLREASGQHPGDRVLFELGWFYLHC